MESDDVVFPLLEGLVGGFDDSFVDIMVAIAIVILLLSLLCTPIMFVVLVVGTQKFRGVCYVSGRLMRKADVETCGFVSE